MFFKEQQEVIRKLEGVRSHINSASSEKVLGECKAILRHPLIKQVTEHLHRKLSQSVQQKLEYEKTMIEEDDGIESYLRLEASDPKVHYCLDISKMDCPAGEPYVLWRRAGLVIAIRYYWIELGDVPNLCRVFPEHLDKSIKKALDATIATQYRKLLETDADKIKKQIDSITYLQFYTAGSAVGDLVANMLIACEAIIDALSFESLIFVVPDQIVYRWFHAKQKLTFSTGDIMLEFGGKQKDKAAQTLKKVLNSIREHQEGVDIADLPYDGKGGAKGKNKRSAIEDRMRKINERIFEKLGIYEFLQLDCGYLRVNPKYVYVIVAKK